MNAAIGALIGVLAAAGTVAIVQGLRRTEVIEPVEEVVDWRRLRSRASIVVLAMVAGWMATGWPAVGALMAATGVVVPNLLEARRDRRHALERTEGLAAWAEMLRDTIVSHAGLREAIAVTATVAPTAIRSDVRRLAARAERESLSIGLRRFADEVADPVADLIVAALTVAADGQARNLPALLSEIASTARAEAHMQMRIETGRARTYSSSRALVVITFGLSMSLLIFAPEFMAPLATVWGQLVLLIVAGLFGGALWGLIALSRPAPSPRLLAGVAEQWGDVAS